MSPSVELCIFALYIPVLAFTEPNSEIVLSSVPIRILPVKWAFLSLVVSRVCVTLTLVQSEAEQPCFIRDFTCCLVKSVYLLSVFIMVLSGYREPVFMRVISCFSCFFHVFARFF